MAGRSRPIEHDRDLRASLYAPTPTNPKYRVVYVDPFTGERKQPRRTDPSEAETLWGETLEYLRAARLATPVPAAKERWRGPTVDDLWQKRLQRWVDDGCSEGLERLRLQSDRPGPPT